jgi:hypothetical protein
MWLQPRAVIAADVDDPVIVTCVSGSLWITAHETGDLLVSTRQTVVVRGPGRLVIEALTATRLELSNVARAAA